LFGHDGMSGTAVILGAGQSPQASMIQVNGASAIRLEATDFTAACDRSASLRTLLLRYVQAMNVQAASTAAANAHYALPERLARWLLMCHDRVDGDDIPITHEFMSMMLAVRRAGVTTATHILESNGLIRAKRGVITILDRDRLEALADNAYGLPEAEYARIMAEGR
jgi:CRP-like cAMP-binding protein